MPRWVAHHSESGSAAFPYQVWACPFVAAWCCLIMGYTGCAAVQQVSRKVWAYLRSSCQAHRPQSTWGTVSQGPLLQGCQLLQAEEDLLLGLTLGRGLNEGRTPCLGRRQQIPPASRVSGAIQKLGWIYWHSLVSFLGKPSVSNLLARTHSLWQLIWTAGLTIIRELV